MLKFGAHAFVWIGDWNRDDGNFAIAEAGKTGFDFIEIPLLKPEAFDIESHKAALEKAGIYATCSLVLPKEAHMPDAPEEAYAFLISVLDVMQGLGSSYLGGCIAYSLGTLTGQPPRPDERATVVEVLGKLASEAAKRDITLALEACNRYETYLYNSLADTRASIQAVGAENLKLHADTYHMNIEEEGFYKPIIETADLLDYIHMSESHRGLVGSGTVNWEQVWQALADINFDGHLVLESFAAINPDLAAATCLWRPPNQGSEVLATEGLKFLKDGAKRVGLLG
ncbi:MAG: sugar phosphate isomerase/epimerase family protein [Chloroflexota bacterium]